MSSDPPVPSSKRPKGDAPSALAPRSSQLTPEAPGGEGGRERLYEVIFEAETPAGKAFDVALLVVIVLSVLAVVLESVAEFNQRHHDGLRIAEWVFTLLFTVEYGLRLLCVRRPWGYATSFFGVIDLAALLPTYLSLFVPGAQSLLVVRAFRLLRVFRVLKLVHFAKEALILVRAIRTSLPKITVFIGTVLSIALTVGALMYFVEGEGSGFTSIPRAMYWAIVTMTTVGYGDITPQTVFGQTVAALLMIMGYGILAVPTGIMSVEIAHAARAPGSTRTCAHCLLAGHDLDAVFCRQCGQVLGPTRT